MSSQTAAKLSLLVRRQKSSFIVVSHIIHVSTKVVEITMALEIIKNNNSCLARIVLPHLPYETHDTPKILGFPKDRTLAVFAWL